MLYSRLDTARSLWYSVYLMSALPVLHTRMNHVVLGNQRNPFSREVHTFSQVHKAYQLIIHISRICYVVCMVSHEHIGSVRLMPKSSVM